MISQCVVLFEHWKLYDVRIYRLIVTFIIYNIQIQDHRKYLVKPHILFIVLYKQIFLYIFYKYGNVHIESICTIDIVKESSIVCML